MINYSKYRTKRTIVDGITFASMKEAHRYQELKVLEKARVISNLQLQVPFVLIDKSPVNKRAIRYVADFVYEEDGKQVVEDTKGFKTDVYKIKRALMYQKYQIIIKES